MTTAKQRCKDVGLYRCADMAEYHGVSQWTVSYWFRTDPDLFERKLQAAVRGLQVKKGRAKAPTAAAPKAVYVQTIQRSLKTIKDEVAVINSILRKISDEIR
jgi:hypothetical protein